MKITVAQAIIKCLEAEGIEMAFGISGSHYLAFLSALKDSKIRYISVKHESAAGFMALNYTKVSGKPALLLATAGPGAANLVNGMAEMTKSEIPAFVLTPVIPTSAFGKNGYQEDTGYGASYSVTRLMETIARKSLLLLRPEQTHTCMRELLRKILHPPFGPAHLAVPADLFSKTLEPDPRPPAGYRHVAPEWIEPEKIQRAASRLIQAKSPVLLVGKRCIYPDCSRELGRLIRQNRLPFVLTHSSKGLLNERDAWYGGVVDYFGHRFAEVLLKESDLVLSFGMDFSEAETIKYDPDLLPGDKLVAFDSDSQQFGVNYASSLNVYGALSPTIHRLAEILTGFKNHRRKSPAAFRKRFLRENAAQIREMEDGALPLKPPFVFNELSRLLEKKALVFSDTGASSFSSVRHFISGERAYFSSCPGYSMGSAVAGCIGGKLAAPEKDVFCVCGDGGFLMNGNEVLTAAQYGLGITWIVFVDGLLNMVNINQQMAYSDLDYCVRLKNPDFRHLAAAYGAAFFEVRTARELEKAVKQSRRRNAKKEPVLIIVHYAHAEHLPIKPRIVKSLEEMGHTKNIRSNPALIRAFKKVLDEKT
jgi:acetolactate synthase-1/2/3 large subunit